MNPFDNQNRFPLTPEEDFGIFQYEFEAEEDSSSDPSSENLIDKPNATTLYTTADLLMELEKPTTIKNANFDCSKCSAKFQTQQNLNNHCTTEHKVKRGRPRKTNRNDTNAKKLTKLNLHKEKKMKLFANAVQRATRSNFKLHRPDSRRSRGLRNTRSIVGDRDSGSPKVKIPKVKINIETCQHCKRTFRNKIARLMHIRQKHRDIPKTTPDQSVENVVPPSTESQVQEIVTPSTSANSDENVKPNTPNPQTDAVCEYCSRVFESLRSKNIHVGLKHSAEPAPASENSIESFKNVSPIQSVRPNATTSNAASCEAKETKKPDEVPKRNQTPESNVSSNSIETVKGTETQRPNSRSASEFQDSNNRYNCPDCPINFPSAVDLAAHLQSDHNKIVKKVSGEKLQVFKCEKCNKHFTSERMYRIHEACRHPVEGHNVKRFKNSRSNVITYKCCSEVFNSIFALESHLKKLKDENFFEIISNSDTLIYKCKACTLTYSKKCNVIKHFKNNHTSNVPLLTCTQCGGQFQTQLGLTKHVLARHWK